MTMSSTLSYAGNGVIGAAMFPAGAVPLILTSTAAAAGEPDNAVVGGVSIWKRVAKVLAGAVVGAVAAATAGVAILNAVGFTAAGPAAGSYAAAWMSSIAVANGGGVAAGSLYSVLQATAMGGGVVLGAPAVLAVGAVGAVVGAVVWSYYG